MTMQEIRVEGIRALFDRLGPSGAIQFLQQFDFGRGDYTLERQAWVDNLTVDEIVAEIKRQRG